MRFIKRFLDYDYRESTRLLRLFALAILVHVVILYGTLDVFFSTAVFEGLPSHRSNTSLSKRVVVFVLDGLETNGLYQNDAATYAPFLTRTRFSEGAWGISQSQIPSYSYPGHITIFSGRYEDPNSVTNAWNLHPIGFDHVFNQSRFSYLWGNPDIVTIFNQDNLENIYSEYYEPWNQNVSKEQLPMLMDNWVFKKVKIFLKKNKSVKQREKSIFFLHLSGMDVASQIYYRNSMEYKQNLMFVDKGIAKMVQIMEKIFNDKNTTYIFTSNLGMSNRCSPRLSLSEQTEAPFVIWGANVKPNGTRQDLKQADIAAIISGLLGINNPINSVGIFRDEFFSIPDKHKYEILYANTMTLFQQYIEGCNRLKRNFLMLLSRPYKDLDHLKKTVDMISIMMQFGFYKKISEELKNLTRMIVEQKEKHTELSRIPMTICLRFSLVLFMMYTLMMGVKFPTYVDKPVRMFKWNLFLICSGIILIIVTVTIGLYVPDVGLRDIFYIMFPFILMLFVIYEWEQLHYFLLMISTAKLKHIAAYILIIGGINILGLTLVYRSYITYVSLGIMIWMFINTFNQERFCNNILLVLISIIFPTLYDVSYDHNTHNYIFATFAVIVVIHLLISVGMKGTSNSPCAQTNYLHQSVIFIQIICLCVSWTNIIIYTNLAGVSEWAKVYVNVTSWTILVISLFLAILHPRTLTHRSIGISVSLFNIFFLMSFNGESLFIALIMWLCLIWSRIEFRKMKKNSDITIPFAHEFNSQYRVFSTRVGFEEFRRCFIYFSLMLIAFFGAGYDSHLITFDLICMKCFMETFNPFFSVLLIMIKLMIPIFITTSAFLTINVFRRIPIITTFSIIMFYSDFLILHMMCRITNKESSSSTKMDIARFTFTIVLYWLLMVIYTVLSYLGENEMFDWLSAPFHRWIGAKVKRTEENKALFERKTETVTPGRLFPERVIPEMMSREMAMAEMMFPKMVITERVTSGRMSSERVSSETVSLKRASSERVSWERVSSKRASLESVSSKRVSSEVLSREKMTLEKMTSEIVTTERANPERETPERETLERVFSERVTPESVTPERVTSEEVTTERVIPVRFTPGRITLERGTAERVTSERQIPERLASESTSNTSQDNMSRNISSGISDNTSEFRTAAD